MKVRLVVAAVLVGFITGQSLQVALAQRISPSGGSFDGTLAAAGTFAWTGRSTMTSPADGAITLKNAAGTGFTTLRLGGDTSSFPALRRTGATVEAVLADASAYANAGAAKLQLFGSGGTGTTHASLGSVVAGMLVYCSDCTRANPCASGGTGAIAMGLNNTWMCDGGS